MAEYRLYCFAQSGNAYKAALALELAGADWEPRFVDYFNGETHTAEYRELNPMGEVPVLQHGEVRLAQSGAILDYLQEQLGRFGPRTSGERRELLSWLLFDNHKLTSYTATHRFLLEFTESPDAGVLEFLHTRSRAALGVLDTHLHGREFVVGNRPTIADLSLCGYLFWAEELRIDWSRDFPAIGEWLERIRDLPGWVHPYELMPGHPR